MMMKKKMLLCGNVIIITLFLFFTTINNIGITTVTAVKIQIENLPEKCDYEARCVTPSNDGRKLNIHLVPHTHDDVGWLKTVDEYYYGTHSGTQKAGVQYILDSVVEELIRNKARRFIYVETAFFWKWWLEQSDEQREIVKELVRSGQLEFINGGWSMNDEATTHYNSIIDQMSWGLRRLNDTFGHCGVPRVAWQIDPFGHSREQAALFAQMNFDALYFAREDHEDRDVRRDARTLEHMWQGSDDLGTGGDLLTGMMYNHYGPLQGLFWDLVNNNDDPIVDNKSSEEYNVQRMVENLVSRAKDFARGYPTNNILVPMGEDFHYQYAGTYFKNMDKLIRAVAQSNYSKEVNVFYSTPSCYTKALHDSGYTFHSKVDDFFPYSSGSHDYWTGYFTSRPALKRFERVGNNVLQVCKQLDVLAGNGGKFESQISALREWMGVMQHHDAVAGTEKQHVSDDYAKNLHAAIVGCRTVISKSIEKLLTKQVSSLASSQASLSSSVSPPTVEQKFCDLLNVSTCDVTTDNRNFVVTVYNPLAHSRTNVTIRVPVQSNTGYQVLDSTQHSIQSYLIPIPDQVRSLAERKNSKADMELLFTVDRVAPLGLKSFIVNGDGSSGGGVGVKAVKVNSKKISTGNGDGVQLIGKGFALHFDNRGEVSHVTLERDGTKVSFRNEFHYYKGADSGGGISGAYVFRPDQQSTQRVAKVSDATLYTSTDGTVQEVYQTFSNVNYISQVIRVRPDSSTIEFEWLVGPIPVGDNVGKEIVSKYITDLNNVDDANRLTFYTDANGRQMLKREQNYRQTWRLSVSEPVSGNYYPVNSRIALRDEKRKLQMTVLNDRTQGGTGGLQSGTLELMIHRRLLHDDGFGVGEALNEPGVDGKGLVVRGKHFVQIVPITEATHLHRETAQALFLEPSLSFASLVENYSNQYEQEFSTALTAELPQNVHLLTLEQWNYDRYLIRLEHYFQRSDIVDDDNAYLTKPITVSLKNLFEQYLFAIVRVEELTLGANQPVENLQQRLKFKYEPIGTVVDPPKVASFVMENGTVTLNPMQIRTFVITVKR